MAGEQGQRKGREIRDQRSEGSFSVADLLLPDGALHAERLDAVAPLSHFRFHRDAYSVSSGTCSSSYFWMRTPSTSMSEASG
jgi:hypothetical protein